MKGIINSIHRSILSSTKIRYDEDMGAIISIDRISCGKGKQVLRREEEQPNKLVFILQNIFEQVYKWEATLYLNFIDFEKAIDSIYRESPLDHHEGV